MKQIIFFSVLLFINSLLFSADNGTRQDLPSIISSDGLLIATENGNVKCIKVFCKQFMQLAPSNQLAVWNDLNYAMLQENIKQLRHKEIVANNKNPFAFCCCFCLKKSPSQKIETYLHHIENYVKSMDIKSNF